MPYAISNPGGHDEFYWNVTGNDWPVPIDHVSAEVLLPAKASGAIEGAGIHRGLWINFHEVTSNVDGASTSFETTNPLPIRGGMTIDVYIPAASLNSPAPSCI